MLNCVSCVVVAFVAGRRWALFNDIVVGECGVANSQTYEDSFFVFFFVCFDGLLRSVLFLV